MLLKNGLLVLENGSRKGDLRIRGTSIAQLGEQLQPELNEAVLDLSGKVILPGGVDGHTHFDLDLGNVRATDDFFTGTVAAACGGTTTIIDHMAFGPKGGTITQQVKAYHCLAAGKAVVDYGFHGVIDHVDAAVCQEMKTLIADGITSYKFYLTYDGKISDYEVMKLMDFAADSKILLAVHAENDGAIAYLREQYAALKPSAPMYHAKSRPPESEADAVSRMILFAQMANHPPLYFVHLSTALGLKLIREARRRGSNNLFAETCPQYLLLDDSCYQKPDGLKYIMSPPLRAPKHVTALWEGIERNDIDVIATDHCPFFYQREKQFGKDDFTKAPGGVPGVELRLPLMFSEVAKGRLTLEKLVTRCCCAPARLFGIYPQKGVIAVGSDADLVVIDPTLTKTITTAMLHENSDYTPYEGMTLKGLPILTFLRGEIIVSQGEFIGVKGGGRYLKRGMPMLTRLT
jgi:dihydropyrimidinase